MTDGNNEVRFKVEKETKAGEVDDWVLTDRANIYNWGAFVWHRW
jgi:hypothetical protein